MKSGFFFALSLLAAASVNASCGKFCGGVEGLYWKPIHSPIPFATAADLTVDPTVKPTEQRAHLFDGVSDWGVRAHIGYECGCLFTDLSYLYFDSSGHKAAQRNGAGVFGIQGLFGLPPSVEEIKSRLNEKYQYVDWRLGATVCCGPCGSIRAYGNVRWADINWRSETHAVGFDAFYKQRARFDGAGLGFGLEAQAPIFCGLGAHGRIGLMGLIGSSRLAEQRVFNPTTTTPFFRNVKLIPVSASTIVPVSEFRVGLDYTYCCSCFTFVGFVGYELDYFHDTLGFSSSVESGSNGLPDVSVKSIGFGGLYFGIRVCYN